MKEVKEEQVDNKYQIPLLDKVFELLEILRIYPQGLTMQDLVNQLQQPKTTLYRLLSTLLDKGYLVKNIETSHYTLSRKWLRLGLAALGEMNIVEQSLPPMRRLRDSIRESVMLGVFMDANVVLLEQVLGTYDFTFLLRPGTRFCMHASAPGKLFLAYLPFQERIELLNQIELTRFNEHTLVDRKALDHELDTIRQQGYAFDLEEEMYGIHCVATPIFDQFGGITATIWTSGPSGRLTQEQMPQVARQLLRTTQMISTTLGYTSSL